MLPHFMSKMNIFFLRRYTLFTFSTISTIVIVLLTINDIGLLDLFQ